MRFLIALGIVLGLAAGTSSLSPELLPVASDWSVATAQQPDAQIDIDVDRGGGAWYTSPMWIAIGVIALVVIILLVAMAARGGGTTVIRD
jgi:hypothetical protein